MKTTVYLALIGALTRQADGLRVNGEFSRNFLAGELSTFLRTEEDLNPNNTAAALATPSNFTALATPSNDTASLNEYQSFSERRRYSSKERKAYECADHCPDLKKEIKKQASIVAKQLEKKLTKVKKATDQKIQDDLEALQPRPRYRVPGSHHWALDDLAGGEDSADSEEDELDYDLESSHHERYPRRHHHRRKSINHGDELESHHRSHHGRDHHRERQESRHHDSSYDNSRHDDNRHDNSRHHSSRHHGNHKHRHHKKHRDSHRSHRHHSELESIAQVSSQHRHYGQTQEPSQHPSPAESGHQQALTAQSPVALQGHQKMTQSKLGEPVSNKTALEQPSNKSAPATLAAPSTPATSFNTTQSTSQLNNLLNQRFDLKQQLAGKAPSEISPGQATLAHDLELSIRVAASAEKSKPIIPYSTDPTKALPKVSFDEEDFLDPNTKHFKGKPWATPEFDWAANRNVGNFEIVQEDMPASSFDSFMRLHFNHELPYPTNQNAGKCLTLDGRIMRGICKEDVGGPIVSEGSEAGSLHQAKEMANMTASRAAAPINKTTQAVVQIRASPVDQKYRDMDEIEASANLAQSALASAKPEITPEEQRFKDMDEIEASANLTRSSLIEAKPSPVVAQQALKKRIKQKRKLQDQKAKSMIESMRSNWGHKLH